MNPLIQAINQKNVSKGRLAIWWIGQEGYVIKTPDLIVYIDPYLSEYAERITKGKHNEHVRITPAPMKPEEVTHADLVLCTHDHGDHIDPDGIPAIARSSEQAVFVVPECARDTMRGFGIADERLHTLKGDDSLDVKGFKVHGFPAKHEQFDQDPAKGYPYLSYVLELEGHTLFHAGDTIPYPGQVERVHPHGADLAFIPINGRDEFRHSLEFEGNFTCEEAVGFALAIKAGLTIPMHYDMFTLNTADVRDFIRIAEHRNLPHLVMECGTPIDFPREEAP
jgi:L-ascorbate metabolism protein UlaG (beta-lactamase superfamily)